VFALRPERIYFPFSMELLKATHTVYEGTDIPKDFRSRVQLQNPQTGENREVEISMNHPLRYAGLTFYQYQMDGG
jgi:cytochrome c biogenesis protein ResB